MATVDGKTGALRVVYAGTAFFDEQGRMHIDCRKSILHGPDSQHWSPDSFSIDKKGGVRWMDDARRNGSGHVLQWAVNNSDLLKGSPMSDKVDEQVTYSALRLSVRVFLEGVL
ncbi:MAG: hypothetical protein HRU15_18410 [Planctomycetes bacterium]|nr:hypothetical protein [Planctomycetota bacterium]